LTVAVRRAASSFVRPRRDRGTKEEATPLRAASPDQNRFLLPRSKIEDEDEFEDDYRGGILAKKQDFEKRKKNEGLVSKSFFATFRFLI